MYKVDGKYSYQWAKTFKLLSCFKILIIQFDYRTAFQFQTSQIETTRPFVSIFSTDISHRHCSSKNTKCFRILKLRTEQVLRSRVDPRYGVKLPGCRRATDRQTEALRGQLPRLASPQSSFVMTERFLQLPAARKTACLPATTCEPRNNTTFIVPPSPTNCHVVNFLILNNKKITVEKPSRVPEKTKRE